MIEEVKDKNVVNLDLSETARTKIWVNGNPETILELNLTDMGVMSRLKDTYPKLDELVDEVKGLASKEDATDDDVVDMFNNINKRMKDMVDYIFDFPVSDICCDGGSMYDPIGGQMRFEYIIDKLSKLYTNSLNEEFKRMQAKVEKHTAKYTKSATKKRK